MNREDFPLIMGSGSGMADCCMGKGMGWKRKPEELIYLDNAATMQRPRQVITAVKEFYETGNANPRRGMYDLAREAGEIVEKARGKVAEFIGASDDEVIFTSGATEGLNMAAGWLSAGLSAEDEILVSRGEHHANLLPWGMIAQKTGTKLRLVDCLEDGTVDEENFYRMLTPNVKVVAMNLVGNVLGGKNDVRRMFRAAHEISGAICVLDAAQAVAHFRVDVRKLSVDIMAFSGHKMGAPMGIGMLYGRKDLLEKMEPWKLGGEMVERVWTEEGDRELNGLRERDGLDGFGGPGGVFMKLAKVPWRFEAGTMNVGGIVGLKAAIEFLEEVGFRQIREHELRLTDYAVEKISEVPGLRVYGAENGIIALNIEGIHSQDTAEILNQEGIAVRAGWHCAQPMLEFLGIGPVVRASFSFYNTEDEVDKLVRALSVARERMGM